VSGIAAFQCKNNSRLSGAAGTFAHKGAGECGMEGVGLSYLWFYLFFSPQRAQRFEGRTSLILGMAQE